MPEFPKIRVKKCFFSDGPAAAEQLAQEIGGITAGKLARWFREWGEDDIPEADEPAPTGKHIKFVSGPKSKLDVMIAEAWHRNAEHLAATRVERAQRMATEKARKKEARKHKKEVEEDEWVAIKKEAKKRGLDPYDLLADKRKKEQETAPVKKKKAKRAGK